MPTNFQKAKRRVKTANGWSDPISYATSSESVELTDGTDLQTKIDNLGTASTKDVATTGDASTTQVVMGNDTRLTDARPANDVNSWAKAPTKPTYTASEVGTYTSTEIDNKIEEAVSSCYHPSGSKTVAELISSLLVSANEGSVYDMSDSGTTTSDFREGAGHPIKAGDNVGIVNVGTTQSPVYKFDLLSGFVDLSAYYTKTESDNKYVDKVAGKGLSTEDYTTTDKTKLAGISEGATQTIANPADTATETLSKLEVGGVVYDIPQGASGATELSELTDVNLSNVEDNDILQYDETANKWKNSNALQGAKTTTGNPLTIEDAAPVNAVNVSMDLEPVQDLHGYDHPWVGGAGKNKLPMTVEGIKAANGGASTWNGNSKTIGGVAFTILTDSDGNVTGIRCNGQANGFSFYAFDGSVTVPSGSKINLNATKNNGNFDCTAFNNGTVIGSISGYSPQTADVTLSDTTVTRVSFYFNSSYNDDITIYPMIRLSTETDSSFAPYTNICPISGRSEVAIQRVGKNLIDVNAITNNKFIAIDGTLQNSSVSNVTDYIKVSGESITLSYDYTTLSDITVRVYAWYDENKKFISSTEYYPSEKTRTITIPNNTKYIRITFDASVTQLQLELGTTATTYESYAGKTYTIQIGQTVYGGQLDVTRGKMVVDRGYAEFDGSSDENWVNAWTGTRVYCADGIRIPNGKVESPSAIGISAISDKYDWTTYDYQSSSMWAIRLDDAVPTAFAIRNDGELFIKDINYSSASALATYLASNPLQLVYELAEPFTIDLTPQQIKMLENTNTIYTGYEGDTIHIEYQPNNAIGEALAGAEIGYDAQIENLKGTTMKKGDYITAGQLPGSILGTKATAEGYNTVASSDFSHAEGYRTLASGKYSHAEGKSTIASGKYSHAEGESTTASSQDSHAEGVYTSASGDISHAEGYYSSASSSYSHAEGFDTLASSTAAHAEGKGTTASNYASHAGGHYNAAMTTGGSANNTTGTAFVIGNGVHTSALSNAFSVQYNGVVKAASTITASTTADYAEFFEWFDENSDNEDRVGLFVTNSEEDYTKIRIANSNDDYILGIVSGDPFVLGNGDCDVWNGMMIRDDFGRVIYEPAQKYEINPETGELEPVYDDEGNPVYEGTKPVYNPEYDPTIPYISRFDRPEWSPIGMLGVLRVYDDGTCEVGGYCTVGEDGKATKVNTYDKSTNCYKVIERITDDIIKVIFR